MNYIKHLTFFAVLISASLIYLPTLQSNHVQSEPMCTICQEHVVPALHPSKITQTTCGHIFHKDCIDEWYNQGTLLCPLCKEPDKQLHNNLMNAIYDQTDAYALDQLLDQYPFLVNYMVRPKEKITLLHDVARKGLTRSAACLMRHGANPEAQTTDGETPIHSAAAAGMFRTMIAILAEGKIKNYWPTQHHLEVFLNQLTVEGLAALHYAAAGGWVRCIKILLQCGASANIQAIDTRYTPLHSTIINNTQAHNTLKIVKHLLCFGAHAQIKDYQGKIPLQHAVLAGLDHIVSVLLAQNSYNIAT